MTAQNSGHDKLDKIRALLAKAESTPYPAEAEALNAKAAELIAKYGIEQALLDAARTDGRPVVVGDRIIRVPAPYAAEKATLLGCIAVPLRVRTIHLNRGSRSDGLDVHTFGFDADLDRVDVLFTSLLVQASYNLANIRPTDPRESAVGYRKAWMAGFTVTVRDRLKAAEERAKQEAGAGPSTDLVLAGRQALVNRRVEEAYPDLKPARKVRVRGSGYDHGKAAGQRADLGGTRIDGAPQRPLSR